MLSCSAWGGSHDACSGGAASAAAGASGMGGALTLESGKTGAAKGLSTLPAGAAGGLMLSGDVAASASLGTGGRALGWKSKESGRENAQGLSKRRQGTCSCCGWRGGRQQAAGSGPPSHAARCPHKRPLAEGKSQGQQAAHLIHAACHVAPIRLSEAP